MKKLLLIVVTAGLVRGYLGLVATLASSQQETAKILVDDFVGKTRTLYA